MKILYIYQSLLNREQILIKKSFPLSSLDLEITKKHSQNRINNAKIIKNGNNSCLDQIKKELQLMKKIQRASADWHYQLIVKKEVFYLEIK